MHSSISAFKDSEQFRGLDLKLNTRDHWYRVARHNMLVMFFNGLDFPMNFLHPGPTNTSCMHQTHKCVHAHTDQISFVMTYIICFLFSHV